ncbi:MAG: GNAT family N-acetyltransferase [Planctomycetes bacterium]|nr:GNAT family N-acetyltransferase [Planctomycetota bacterium]
MSAALLVERVLDVEGFRACLDLQRAIWGFADEDLIPARYLNVVTRIGGVVLGTRHGGRLVGFCFGFPGRRGAEPIFYSHMTGVLEAWRGRGVALGLKLAQRDFALAEGYREMDWTFDPLEARNAAFNVAKLGAVADEYLHNIYGASSGPIQGGLDTDRLVARWFLDSPRVRGRLGCAQAPPGPEALQRVPWALDAIDALDAPDRPRLDLDAPRVAVAVPGDIQGLKRRDLPLARAWREASREVLSHYLGRGYRLVEFLRSGPGGCHLLERRDASPPGEP